MYAALNGAGKLVYASQVAGLGGQASWFCPRCHQPLKLRSGRRVRPHFVHVDGVCGQSKLSKRQVMESERHQAAKRLLGQTFQAQGERVNLEYYLPSSGQFADLYLPQRQWVAEYQQSLISAQLLANRQADYQALGQTVVWLLSADVLRGKFKTRWKQTCLHYAPSWGYYWLALDVEGACLVQDFHLPLVYSRLSYTYQSRTLQLTALSQQAWQADCLAYGDWLGPRTCHCREGQVASHVRSHLVAGHQSYWRQLYQEGIQVGDLPAWCLQGRYQVLVSPEPGWVWLAYQATFLKEVREANKGFTRHDWLLFHERLVRSGKVHLVPTPLLGEEGRARLLPEICQSFLRLWQWQGHLAFDRDRGLYRVVS